MILREGQKGRERGESKDSHGERERERKAWIARGHAHTSLEGERDLVLHAREGRDRWVGGGGGSSIDASESGARSEKAEWTPDGGLGQRSRARPTSPKQAPALERELWCPR